MLLTYKTTQELSQDLNEGKRLYFYDRGEEISLTHQGIWQVYRGAVQLAKLNSNGEDILLGWALPSNFFGMWLTQLEVYQAKALSEVYLRWFTLSEIEGNAELTQVFLNQVMRRMRQTEALLAIVGLRRVEDRLQELLSLLKQEIGEPITEGTRLTVRLTHQNIANTIGTTRVTVTRILGDFQRQGLVSLDHDRHLIINF